MINSIKQLNQAFRAYAKENNISIKRGKPQNDQVTDTRIAYCEFVEDMHRQGLISDYLAQNASYY